VCPIIRHGHIKITRVRNATLSSHRWKHPATIPHHLRRVADLQTLRASRESVGVELSTRHILGLRAQPGIWLDEFEPVAAQIVVQLRPRRHQMHHMPRHVLAHNRTLMQAVAHAVHTVNHQRLAWQGEAVSQHGTLEALQRSFARGVSNCNALCL